ncbi:5,6-dimethylbenzimidazole synthase [Clostridium acetireducens DSM 10703]|jgi:nitroreductase|uniref:5,6-dimethylbenzimidazole synthase n=1 Tax=Clostridium acetireducens DSM 10703 TaxID=1121290 RepID=A0A1E8EXZ8_9CLOT|nr:nitroreductase family protein [Clostridium acetireducens]OFI05800.1 5,6-dimethylbenzimidazole synthase [Clostridium acetireducens DSM 10703]
MQFYDVIENRKSIRNFTENPIPKEKIDKMVTAAMMSPSWKNKTSYKFIIVSDEQKRNELADTIMNNTGEAANSIRQAPITTVVVADPKLSGTIDQKEYYLVDSAIAMEHFMLSATAEGYGTCWIGAFDENKVKNILSVPNNFKVIGMTPVGETNENKAHNPKKDVRDYVFINNWNNAYTENKEMLMH